MRELSVRSLLISHHATCVLFCLFVIIGHGASLTVLHVFTGAELSDLHQRLKSDELFRDIESASALSLSAVAAGWLAARTSNTRPLIHGAISCAAFFLLFLCGTVYGLFQFPGIDVLWHRPLMKVAELALPLFGMLGAAIVRLRRRMPGRETRPHESVNSKPDNLLGDLGPIAWKRLVRLIWVGSVATFETLELLRYWSRQTYRPFFAVFAAAIVALLIWQVACGFRDILQRRQVLAERAASGQRPSPLYIAASGLVVILIGLVLFLGHIHRDHAEISSLPWIIVALIIATLLLVRQTLKWRAPYA